jgi:hypothetical protein
MMARQVPARVFAVRLTAGAGMSGVTEAPGARVWPGR